jgi:hypothetical protein
MLDAGNQKHGAENKYASQHDPPEKRCWIVTASFTFEDLIQSRFDSIHKRMGAIKLKANLNRRWVGVGLFIAAGMALGIRRSMSSRDPITALETAETPNQVVGTDF